VAAKYLLYAGGAITIESKLETEYAETFAKVAIMMKVLNKFYG